MTKVKRQTQGSTQTGSGLGAKLSLNKRIHSLVMRPDRLAGNVFLLPAVWVILSLAIFPLIISLYLSFSSFRFVKGGFELKFVGLANYEKLLTGTEKTRFLGVLANPSIFGWLVFIIIAVLLVISLVLYIRRGQLSAGGLFWRGLAAFVIGLVAWLLVRAIGPDGRPGTLIVTLIYVFIGILFQFLLGLGLAFLTAQSLPGRRFFRIVFFMPMMITPVGIAYLFRMLTDTTKGPFTVIWKMVGLIGFSWVNHPWGARAAVMLGDIWQWTPFVFILLLAALESQPIETFEAAIVDGASKWQIFRYISLPHILPVSVTIIMIRMIEAFKIVDIPNVLTNGGPGTASESLALQSYMYWRALDLGGSSSVSYMLLITVTLVCMCYFNLIHRAVKEKV